MATNQEFRDAIDAIIDVWEDGDLAGAVRHAAVLLAENDSDVVSESFAPQSIIVSGNPVDGFTFYGPFETEQEAIDATEVGPTDDWWVARLWPFEDPGVDAKT